LELYLPAVWCLLGDFGVNLGSCSWLEELVRQALFRGLDHVAEIFEVQGLHDKIKLVPINLQNSPAWYKEKVYPENKVIFFNEI
jgi:hypothetical protein